MQQSFDNDMPRVTVVIPTRNRAHDLQQCLESLKRQTCNSFETIVIDNGSSDRTREVVRQYQVRLMRDERPNLSQIFNLGWQVARTDIVAYLNDDAEIAPNWVASLLQVFERCADAAFVGGPTIAMRPQVLAGLYFRAQKHRLLRSLVSTYERIVLKGSLAEIGRFFECGAYSIGGSLASSSTLHRAVEVDMLTITNLAVRKEALARLGGFDENYAYVHADGDLFVRARRAKLKLIFDPRVLAIHYVSPGGATRSVPVIAFDTGYFIAKNVIGTGISQAITIFINFLVTAFLLLWRAIKNDPMAAVSTVVNLYKGVGRGWLYRFRAGSIGGLSESPS